MTTTTTMPTLDRFDVENRYMEGRSILEVLITAASKGGIEAPNVSFAVIAALDKFEAVYGAYKQLAGVE